MNKLIHLTALLALLIAVLELGAFAQKPKGSKPQTRQQSAAEPSDEAITATAQRMLARSGGNVRDSIPFLLQSMEKPLPDVEAALGSWNIALKELTGTDPIWDDVTPLLVVLSQFPNWEEARLGISFVSRHD
jgi:hypothetical protein